MEYYEPPPGPLTLGLHTGAFATLLGLAVLLVAVPAAVSAARSIRARHAAPGHEGRVPSAARCVIATAVALALAGVSGWLLLTAATAPAFADTTGRASDVGLQRDTITTNHAVAEAFPQIEHISGFRPGPIGGHDDGRALDILIPGALGDDARALGDDIRDFLLSRAEQLGVEHVAWHGRLYLPDGTSRPMDDRGSDVANHMTHLHVHTHGGGYPAAATPGGFR